MAKYSYYPWYAARQSCLEVEDTIQPMSSSLGIQLIEMPGYSSDGGDVDMCNKFLPTCSWIARNFAIAEENGHDIITACASAHGNMSDALHRLQSDAGLLQK